MDFRKPWRAQSKCQEANLIYPCRILPNPHKNDFSQRKLPKFSKYAKYLQITQQFSSSKNYALLPKNLNSKIGEILKDFLINKFILEFIKII